VAIDRPDRRHFLSGPPRRSKIWWRRVGEGMRILRLQGAVPLEAGIPLVMDGKIVGAIGVSGARALRDAQCAKAGAGFNQ